MASTPEQTRTMLPQETLDRLAAGSPQIIATEQGHPVAVLIDYALYVTLQETIDDWYADQHAIAAYERHLQDPSGARPWSEIRAELVEKGLLDDHGAALDD